MALFPLTGIVFNKENLKEAIKEIRLYGRDSLYLGILLNEGRHEDLAWWVDLFVEENK